MDLLALVNRLALECAVSGAPYATVAGATGEQQRLVTWIQQGYQDFQNELPLWMFLRSSTFLTGGAGSGVSFQTVSGQAVYPLGTGPGTVGVTAANFGSWIPYSFRDQTTTVGVQDQIFLDWVSYDVWRDAYSYGAQQVVTTRPVAIAVGPNNSLCVGPWPDATYTITGDYYRSPVALSADADEPSNIPAQFQIAIVYRAMRFYGMYELAPDVVTRGDMGYRQTLRQLATLRAGIITAGRTLA